jgi:hypothetical protein
MKMLLSQRVLGLIKNQEQRLLTGYAEMRKREKRHDLTEEE